MGADAIHRPVRALRETHRERSTTAGCSRTIITVRDDDERLILELGASLTEAGLLVGQNGLWVDEARGVAAIVTPAGIFVGWLDTAWDGPAWPVPKFEAVVHVPAFGDPSGRLRSAISQARASREAALRTCRHCGARKTPGHMHGHDVCQGCAEQQFGVVH